VIIFTPMTESEMEGVLLNFSQTVTLSGDPQRRRKEFLRATIEHYFEKHLYGDMPTSFGKKIADELLLWVQQSPEDLSLSTVYRFCTSSDSGLKIETDENRAEIAKNLGKFIHLALVEFRISMGWDRRCPKCGKGVMLLREDEDEWWSECSKCGFTDNHSIKPAFG
jgi:ribosomal protein S27AE